MIKELPAKFTLMINQLIEYYKLLIILLLFYYYLIIVIDFLFLIF